MRAGEKGPTGRLAEIAGERIRSKPDVIVAQGPAIFPVLAVKDTIPVVFGFSGDPVETGFVNSFARPGQNSTGVSFLALDGWQTHGIAQGSHAAAAASRGRGEVDVVRPVS